MIVSLRGVVRTARGQHMVVEVAGVGYLVWVTPTHALAVKSGEEVTLHTVQVFRDDAQTLFGFASEAEREIFELLLGVTGVGPKSALGVLSALAPTEIAEALRREDDSVFRAVSGIGPKTAKLIVVTLAGKVTGGPLNESGGVGDSGSVNVRDTVAAALTGLGWPERLARGAIEEAVAAGEGGDSAPGLLRATLARLGPVGRGG